MTDEARASRARKRAREELEREHFPAGVSLRLSGDFAAAQALIPAAKQVLARALNLQASGQPLVKLFLPGADGSLVYVYLHGPVKHVYVQPGKKEVKVEEQEEEEQKISRLRCPDVLAGVVHPGDPVVVSVDVNSGLAQYAVHQFHPTQQSAVFNDLEFVWQDSEPLGVESDSAVSTSTLQVRYPKPSMYSGAMKRIVQALYGIGKTSYVDTVRDPTRVVSFDAQNHYHYRWLKTDGVFKFNDEYWLIRIGKLEGVLAKRLDFFRCSTNSAFAQALADIGDTETYAIVSEFGGLPTGEEFPTALEAAVQSGSVRRLLTAEQLQPFYRDDNLGIDKNAFFAGCGWAFSNTGAANSIHNTCWWYSRPAIVQASFHTWSTDGFNSASAFDRYMRAEHWKIELTFALAPDGSVVSAAKLTLVEEQPFEAPNSIFLYDQSVDIIVGYYPKMGHYPVTGAVGHAGVSGEFEYPVDPASSSSGVLIASGMDPTRYPESFTPALRSGGRSAEQADYLSHKAFMAVPRDDNSDRLDRFKFWGRSQSHVRLVDMEPAYEAPVLVFYNGEELEIVRRKAERYVSDRESAAAIDTVPGTYYPGDFFSTSLNLLDPVRTVVTSGVGIVSTYLNQVNSFSVVGLIIPAGCREGYVFVKASYNADLLGGVGGETTSYTGFFADLGGVTALNEYVSDHSNQYTVPNFGTFTQGIYETSVFPGWWSMWTNVFFDWNLGINTIGFRYAVSISAYSFNQAIHAEPQTGWRLLDVPFSYRLSLPSPLSNALAGLPPDYRYVLPDGIELTDVNPTVVTFVGGV